MRQPSEGRVRRPLFLTLFLAALVLTAAGSLAALAAGALLFEGGAAKGFSRGVLGYVRSELMAASEDGQALRAHLERLHEAFRLDLAVYDASGRLVESVGEPPKPLALPALGSESAAPARFEHGWPGRPGFRAQAPLGESGRFLVAQGRLRHEQPPAVFLAVLAIVMGVLALVAWPLARRMSRPLEALTRTARRLGAGDLAARSNIRRADEIGLLARAFDEMAARIESLMRSERELLANVSHELRTPIARIRVALELMEEQSGDPVALKQDLSGVAGDLAELERLVEEVFATARLNTGPGGLPVRCETVDLGRVLREATEKLAREHPQHQLSQEGEPSLLTTSGDPVLLRRLFDNLLDNAGRYQSADAGPIELSVARTHDRIRVAVRDHGPGVGPEDLGQLFTPFFRADRSRSRHSGGLGLGLALCKRIAEAHGGSIEAKLPQGGGLAVEVELPLVEKTGSEGASAAMAGEGAQQTTAGNKR